MVLSKKYLALFGILLISQLYTLISLHAVEIPLDVKEGKMTNIAYVDMELVYNVSPQKSKMMEAYNELKKNYDVKISSITAAIESKKEEFENISKEIEKIKSRPAVAASTGTETADTSLSGAYEKELTKKLIADSVNNLEKDLQEIREKMASEMAEFEKAEVSDVLEQIYRVLEAIAKEDELSLIIDKNYILYGPPGYDITHKVVERLK